MLGASGLFHRGERVAVAVSGGRDSMFLLHLLTRARQTLGIDLCAVHVHHGLREESDREETFVRDFCESAEVPLRVFRVSVPDFCRERRVSAEEGGRILRYRCFETAFREDFCDKIAIAHHRGDNAETVLFHLIRGCGARGARGLLPFVPAKYEGKAYIRPILNLSRERISAYVAKQGVPFSEDATNADLTYSRNRLRHQALPALERAHAGAIENLCAFGSRMAALTEYLAAAAKEYLRGADGIALDTPEVLLAEAAGACLSGLGAETDLSAAHLRALAALEKGRNGARCDLPGGVTAERQYDRIRFFRAAQKEHKRFPFGFGAFELGEYLVEISETPGRGGRLLSADFSAIPADAVLRFPETGDVFRKFGGGRKKLSDLFTDWKVPRSDRAGVPLVASGNRVLCVLTRDISADLACGKDSRIIYFRTQKKGE